MMDNIKAVTHHIKSKVQDPLRETLTVIPAKDGRLYVEKDGNFWAVCVFIPGSMSYERAETPELAYQGGVGIGQFQTLLADYDKPLNETIKGFHNIRWRFCQWDETIKADPVGRVAEVREEISWIESRREQMLAFWSLVEDGTIPTRVTHNDTKISNILFDKESGKVLCAIDLDTVMPGLSVHDYGDSIRFGAATATESEPDPSKMKLDLHLFEVYTRGFLEAAPSLTDLEVKMLPMGALTMTLEVGIRFLADYLNGDVYFRTAYPEHNKVRCRTQLALVADMLAKWDEMNRIVTEVAAEVRK